MFEHISQEQLLDDALDEVVTDVDKREGAIIYDALAPHSIQLYELYFAMDGMIQEMYGDTASREFLVKLCLDRGITPYLATHAILKGEFNIDVPIGTRFSLDTLNYIVTEKISYGVFKLQCETTGVEGNNSFGQSIPIEYIEGLTTANITELLIPGENEEETESLRKRYLDSFEALAYGGNRKDYKEKIHELQGVGGVKSRRIREDGFNVKVVVMDSQYKTPSEALLEELQTTIDPVSNQGEGVGLAPIGHVVKIIGVNELRVDVAFNITYESGYSWADIEIGALELVDDYLLELKKTWEDNTQLIVRIIQLESRALELTGVLDVQDTLINGAAENLILGEDDIPIRGVVSG
ncbi:baseplate J/gp47 family protein [Viridibacillus sp. NPDC096237]|uniref:baseplate J/gp47 family protein n=1 Tax=Viridibacillus sp. NPDC096237 TaxID=3390721 RepID=UPI003D04AD1E